MKMKFGRRSGGEGEWSDAALLRDTKRVVVDASALMNFRRVSFTGVRRLRALLCVVMLNRLGSNICGDSC